MRIAAFIAASSFLLATSPAIAGEVKGAVYDADGMPVSGMTVAIDGTELGAVTDENGSYRFADVPAGEHRITVNRGASAVQYVPLTVTGETPVTRNVFLLSAAYVEEELSASRRMNAMIAEAMSGADRMTAQVRSRDPVAWRWRDHEG